MINTSFSTFSMSSHQAALITSTCLKLFSTSLMKEITILRSSKTKTMAKIHVLKLKLEVTWTSPFKTCWAKWPKRPQTLSNHQSSSHRLKKKRRSTAHLKFPTYPPAPKRTPISKVQTIASISMSHSSKLARNVSQNLRKTRFQTTIGLGQVWDRKIIQLTMHLVSLEMIKKIKLSKNKVAIGIP